MVRKLFILRHGEAESKKNGSDHDRPLTDQGIHTVSQMGEKLMVSPFEFDRVLCSSALRTKETARHFLKSFGQQPEVTYLAELYNAPTNTVKQVLMNLDTQAENVVLIGHNPSVSDLAAYLLDIHFLSLAPGQLIAFDLSIDDWESLYKGCGTLIEI